MSESGRVWYKLRGALIAPVYVFSMVFFGYEQEGWFIYLLGGILFSAGWIMRVWSQMHLHYRLKVHKVLTRTGPYAFVRNPIYIGNTLILVGITVLSKLLWLSPIMLACCVITYTLVVRYEEKHLAGKYGQPYLDYLREVPRWIPRQKIIRDPSVKKFGEFLGPSIRAESHIFLLLFPVVIKEVVRRW